MSRRLVRVLMLFAALWLPVQTMAAKAMPSLVVKMWASTIDTPESASAPATFMNNPG